MSRKAKTTETVLTSVKQAWVISHESVDRTADIRAESGPLHPRCIRYHFITYLGFATMTNVTAPLTTRFTAITRNPGNIDWAQTGRTLLGWAYNVAVMVGVAFYLCYLACQFAFNLGCTVRGLWIEYEMTAKLAATKAALTAEFKALPGLSVRLAEVKAAYAAFGSKVTSTLDAMKADYSAMSGQ